MAAYKEKCRQAEKLRAQGNVHLSLADSKRSRDDAIKTLRKTIYYYVESKRLYRCIMSQNLDKLWTISKIGKCLDDKIAASMGKIILYTKV